MIISPVAVKDKSKYKAAAIRHLKKKRKRMAKRIQVMCIVQKDVCFSSGCVMVGACFIVSSFYVLTYFAKKRQTTPHTARDVPDVQIRVCNALSVCQVHLNEKRKHKQRSL